MTECLRIIIQKGRRGIFGSISKVESLTTGSHSEYLPDISYPPIPQVVEKPTEVEHRPIPEIDKK